MRARAVPIAVVIGVALLACSSCSAPSAQPPSSTTTTTAPTTTTTIAPTTTTLPIVPAPSAAEAANAFIAAWRNSDPGAAASIATPEAIDAVFRAGDPGRVENRGCDTPVEGPVLCVYRTAVGEVQVRVQPRSDGWFVDQAIVSAD